MRTLCPGGWMGGSLWENCSNWTFLERHIIAVWWCPKQQPARHAGETSKQRASLSSAEFLSIIFCIFLQMTQSPPPSPLIPPNYHFSSMSPHPTGMGGLGVARSCHEMCLSRMCITEGVELTQENTHIGFTQSTALQMKRGVHESIMWLVLPLKGDGGTLAEDTRQHWGFSFSFSSWPPPQLTPPFAFVAITAAARLSNPTVWRSSLGWC